MRSAVDYNLTACMTSSRPELITGMIATTSPSLSPHSSVQQAWKLVVKLLLAHGADVHAEIGLTKQEVSF